MTIRILLLLQIFPHFILMHPDWVGIMADEFLDFCFLFSRGYSFHPFLFAIYKDNHEFFASFISGSALLGSQFLFRFSGHNGQDKQEDFG